MFDRILAPLDVSRLAECVFAHTAALANTFQSQVTVIHVIDSTRHAAAVQVDPLDWQLQKVEAQHYLDQVCQRFRQLNLNPNAVLLEGLTADRIIDYARENSSDLIILSSHGRSGLSSWNLNSIVQKVIARANTSVMIVRAYRQHPRAGEDFHYRRILVPLDGSLRAECVLPVATALAQHHQAELILAHVVAQPEMFHRLPLTATDEALALQIVQRNLNAARDYFANLTSQLTVPFAIRLPVSTDISAALLDLAEHEDIDLLLLSAHGFSGNKQRPYGSVVTSTLAYGSIPALIVQDLTPDEIEPSYAELAAQSFQRNEEPRRSNVPHQV